MTQREVLWQIAKLVEHVSKHGNVWKVEEVANILSAPEKQDLKWILHALWKVVDK